MEKFQCTVCGYIYDPAENDNVKFEDLPDDYTCPLCHVGKDMFEKYEGQAGAAANDAYSITCAARI